MERIVVFGCSNTQGESLPDIPDFSHNVSEYSWPAVLSKNLGFDVWNNGRGGVSNKFILHTLLNTPFLETDIVVIMWTAFNRTCFISPKKVIRILQSDINRTPFNKQIYPKHSSYYYKHWYSEYNSWYESMVQINLAKAHLDSLGLPNLHLTWDDTGMAKSRPMWNKVDLINENFNPIDYGRDNSHPGIQSHRLMAEFIQKHLELIL